MNRFILPLAIFAIIVAFLAVGLGLKPRELPSPFIGKAAPDFAAPELLVGNEFSNAQMQGDVWLLNVWASWCVACRTEHPLLNRLARADVAPIVGLNYKDDPGEAAAWLDQLGNPYARIPVDPAGDVGIDYGVYGVPETYVIDRQGVIRYKQIGPITEAALADDILPLIAVLKEES